MAKKKTTIRLWLRTDRMNNDGTCPIHVVYQIQGQRKYFAVPDLTILPMNWDPEEREIVYRSVKTAHTIDPKVDSLLLMYKADVDAGNVKLADLKKAIQVIENNFTNRGIEFGVEHVIEAYKTSIEPNAKKTIPGESVADFILKFADETTTREHQAGTLKVYRGLAKHIKDFEKTRTEPVTFTSIDTKTLKALHGYLEKDRKNSDGETVPGMISITSAKQISTLKTLLNYARSRYKITVNQDYKDYKVARKMGGIEVISLTEEEFQVIYNMDLSKEKALDRVRDFWMLSVATGFRYSDLEDLKRDHIESDGVIRKKSVKTKQNIEVPLNPYSAAILKKYRKMERPIPVISNQKTNQAIKVIAERAGIDTPLLITRERNGKMFTEQFLKWEKLSCHTGRKSFITLSLEKGIAAQDVMSLSGHTTWPAFKRYVDVTSNRKKEVMAKGWGKVKSN